MLVSSIRQAFLRTAPTGVTSRATAARALFMSKRLFSTNSDSFLLVDRQGNGVVTLRFNRPELHNAFNEHFIAQVTDFFTDIKNSAEQPRVVVLTGEGKSFSAGGDLNYMKKMVNFTHQQNVEDSQKLYDMFYAIRSCPAPVIAAVNGSALGGGCGIVSACDIAFGVDGAMFGFTEAGLGLIPAVISPFVMKKIGAANCSRYFVTAERFGAQKAREVGLLDEVVESQDELDEVVSKTVRQILKNSPAAVRACKQLVEAVEAAPTVLDAKEYTCNAIANARASEEGQEGLAAFLEKRKPSWINN